MTTNEENKPVTNELFHEVSPLAKRKQLLKSRHLEWPLLLSCRFLRKTKLSFNLKCPSRIITYCYAQTEKDNTLTFNKSTGATGLPTDDSGAFLAAGNDNK